MIKCSNFGTCGGCRLQHMSMSEQLELKQQHLIALLEGYAGAKPDALAHPLDGPKWNYRYRARLAVKYVPKKGGVLVGFRESEGSYVTEMEHCEILAPGVSVLIGPLRDLIGSLSIAHRIPQIEVAASDECIALTLRYLEPFSQSDYEALNNFEREHNVLFFIQSGGPETVLPLAELKTPLTYSLPEWDLSMTFGPLDFIQVNPAVNRKLIQRVIDWLEPQPGLRVADLFCGLGNFSLPIAAKGAQVRGFELVDAQVERARENARCNGLEGRASFEVRDLYAGNSEASFLRGFSQALIDPPRSGAEELLRALPPDGPSRIVYVSCNPLTLARDAGILVKQKGYDMKKYGVVNMFPHTLHAEAIAMFEAGHDKDS